MEILDFKMNEKHSHSEPLCVGYNSSCGMRWMWMFCKEPAPGTYSSGNNPSHQGRKGRKSSRELEFEGPKMPPQTPPSITSQV